MRLEELGLSNLGASFRDEGEAVVGRNGADSRLAGLSSSAGIRDP